MTTTTQPVTHDTNQRGDIQQHVTNTIIRQLEAGTVPWHQPWKGAHRVPGLPQNFTTGKKYQGINILLLWGAALVHDYPTQEWATFKQWQSKKQSVRKGEKGSLVVYYDVLEKEVDGKTTEIPYLKSSYVFNRCQLNSYEDVQVDSSDPVAKLEGLINVDAFIGNTKAIIEHKGGRACYIPSLDKIWLPFTHEFIDTQTCTASEGYASTVMHELVHWSGHETRLNREKGKRFGDDAYAAEELVAELGAAFLCAEQGIPLLEKGEHANYIASWLKMLKENKRCIFTAASQASKAVGYLNSLQPV